MGATGIKQWDIWLADFPYEEDHKKFSSRPIIVLNIQQSFVLAVKITKHSPRSADPYDVTIVQWKQSGLMYPSTARVSKTMKLPHSSFRCRLGVLSNRDQATIYNTFIKFINAQKK